MDRTELAGCPKCGVGPGVRKENATPARWIECTACGFVLGSFEETWAELAALRAEQALAERDAMLAEAMQIIGQIEPDHRYPPAPDSMERRIERARDWVARSNNSTTQEKIND